MLNFLVSQAGKGGELTHDETTIISGALDLTEKVNPTNHQQYMFNVNLFTNVSLL